MFDGWTFETQENQGNKQNRSWKKLMDLSDEICEKYGFSVIENPEKSKGKSHYEWELCILKCKYRTSQQLQI